VNVSNSVSYETFAQQFVDLVQGLDTTNTTLIVFGEMVNFPSVFIGTRGSNARTYMATPNASLEDAMLMLAESYAVQMMAYEHKYGPLPLVNLLELALTDVMWRAFIDTFTAIAKSTNSYVVACTIAPPLTMSTNWADILLFGDPDIKNQESVYMALNGSVFNTAFLFQPDGSVISSVDKHFLTDEEINLLHLTPGSIADNHAITLPDLGTVCIAICFDAFHEELLSLLDLQGCTTLIQPTYNTGPWAIYENNWWQPDDWQHSTWGSIQSQYPHIMYNVNAMLVGNLADMVADGQSSIHMKSDQPAPLSGDLVYIAVDNVNSNYTGTTLALAPWVIPDPGIANPQLSLDQRRYILAQESLLLAQTDAYVITVVGATLTF